MVTAAAPSRVQRERRFARTQPCPVCGGWQRGPHGQHCHGFYSADFMIAYCSEIAGETPINRAGHYAHRVDPAQAKFRRPAPTPAGRDKRRLHAVIPASFLDGWHKTLEFPYHNADGSLLYLRVRYDAPADRASELKRVLPFQQVAGEYGDAWAMDEEGLADRLPLYRWPELLAAPATRTIFIVEGENCADALRALGLLATTNPNGAGKWHLILPSGSQEALRGHPLVLLPDAGDTGHAHMEDVAGYVAPVGSSVRIVELPGLSGKEDVVEWLARSGDAVQLLELALATPVYVTPASTGTAGNSGDSADTADAAALRAANVELNRRLSWTERVTTIPKERLSPGAKETAIFLRRELPRHARHVDPDGFLPLYLPTLAKARGVSPSTLSAHLVELDSVGAYRRRERTHLKPNGQRITRISIAPGPALDTPGAWVPAHGPRKAHGGARARAGRPPKCPSCQSTNVRIVERTIRVLTCQDCGDVSQEQVGGDRPVITPDASCAPEQDRPEGPAGNQDEFRSTDSTGDSTDHSRSRPFQNVKGDAEICTDCGASQIECYDARGRPFCLKHAPIPATGGDAA